MPEFEDVPDVLVRVANLMARFRRPWALCGGWGVDSWLGRQSREHLDVDLSILEEDQVALHSFLNEGWLLNGHDPHDDDSTHPWDGHRLQLPAHIHARGNDLNLDVQLNRRDGNELVLREDPPVAIGTSRAIAAGPWGLPTLAPEAILFFKVTSTLRPHDQADIELLESTLSADARTWLDRAIRSSFDVPP